ncbi:cytochrome b5-like heme/steroid binding domain-containing protein [Dactylonectria estremocensis]|uniref:Cytochrome b5-like heme/steroid binding domain-containing protein n=1 Tax=Dactylonectria estremocensis TaxID=1079267 RepID=A0A9P9J526_9HYPO|nr:cytochrome b5-like heme/steroid binding domain-containing protein [Dactylonectria estremocensis]
MASATELTYQDVAEHSTKSDLYVVIHDKVYNCSSFIDEHPGGEEVMMDLAGADATEAFEDVGHSDEAREILEKLQIGDLKRQPSDPKPTDPHSTPASAEVSGGRGAAFYVLLAIGGLVASGAYQYLQTRQEENSL